MGKRIISQARGHGSKTYRVRVNAYKYKSGFPREISGEGKVIKLLNSTAHSTPLAKIKYGKGTFYIPAFKHMFEGQKINFGKEIKEGNIMKLKDLQVKTEIYCIESRPNDGGVFVKSGGNSAVVTRVTDKEVFVLMPSKKEKKFNPECRAVVGVIAGHGRLEKPFLNAGRKHHLMKSKNKLWPRTSALKMNAIDHPFGSGRGKNPKSKTAKRNAPAGRRVGSLRPKRTGYRK